MTKKPVTMMLSCLLAGFGSACAADIFVSPAGDDSNAGTAEAPLGSLATAKSAAAGFAGKEAVTVHVADGIYYLPETLVFAPEDSGSETHPVIYQAQNEGGAVLSGGSELKLSWESHENGIYKAQTPAGLNIDQLFIDGRMQRMARYPNFDPAKKAEPYQGYSADAVSKERAALWADPSGGYIHAMHRSRWGGYHYLITGKDDKGELIFEGGWQNNRKTSMHEEYRMVENIFEELDAENEWYHNAKANTLYYKPVAKADINSVKVEVVRLRHLVEFQGSEDQPVKHITLQGFVVRHAARTFMDVKEQLLRSDWAIYRGGAYLLTGTENIQILNTEFDQVGGNAVFVNNYNRDVLVKGCHIHDAGASGVCFVGDPDAVRDPLFEYGEKNDLSKIDRTVGPKTNNYPSESAVEDCLIHGIGRVERQPAGVQIEMAMKITVRDTSIYDTARAGINIGDGAWGGHLIERVDVFDTVLETHDHGSFNSWGRDRYWRSDHLTATQKAVDEDPQLPYLDAMETTIIRDSRWRCDHGWDIDLDDGSSNYDLYNNLMLAGGLKLREGYRRHAWNNITVNNGFHPHVWFQGSKDQVYSNIFMQSHRAARMNEPYTRETKVDENFYAAEKSSIMGLSAKLGWDENSVFGDPMFVDPANGDFRVKDGSPALEAGFKNFPMDQFGVKKPSLKAIARTPVIPVLKSAQSKAGKLTQTEPHSSAWMGAELRELSGVEFSAYGVSEESGGVALSNLPAASVLENAGIKKDDLIQGVNGKTVTNIAEFFRALTEDKTVALKLTVVRDQKNIEVTVTRASIVETDSASSADDLKKLPVPKASGLAVSASIKTGNESLSILTDGKLAENFGAVIGNTIQNGSYKMDLGAVKPVTAVSSWSYNMGKSRGAQKLTVYASNSATDPGWNLKNFIVLGSVDTGAAKAEYTAASVQALEGKTLGNFRWIIWAVSPVTKTGGGENTAFQEFSVETK
ncbi:MAG: right-handed parallel beta-helix repeat-containing protein [Luteolibacter sp.]